MTAAGGGALASVRVSGLGIHLREWTDRDLDAMVRLFDEPEVDRWTPLRSPFDLAAARAYLAKSREGRVTGDRLHLAITTDGQTPLGEVLVVRTESGGRTGELGYVIGAEHRRQGLAHRALRLLTDYCYTALRLDRALLRIEAENAPSVGVARAAGYRLTDDPVFIRDGVELFTWQHQR